MIFGYVRVSTDEQVISGLSLEAQETRIRAHVTHYFPGLDITLLRDEGVSGQTPLARRPGGSALLERLRSGDVVIAVKPDRLFRRAEDCLRTVRQWTEANVSLHLIDFGGHAIDTSTAAGKLWLGNLALFAEFEANLASERTKAALAAKRARGEVCGNVPWGWSRDGQRLVPNERERSIAAYVIRTRELGASLRRIVALLRKKGMRSRRGRPLNVTQVRRMCRRQGGGQGELH